MGQGHFVRRKPVKDQSQCLSRAGVAEAARFGQLSVLAQRRVLSRWNWLMIPLMRTTLSPCLMVRLSSSKEKTSITPTTRHLPRLQVRHQQRRRRYLHDLWRRRSRDRRRRLRIRGRRRGRGYRR